MTPGNPPIPLSLLAAVKKAIEEVEYCPYSEDANGSTLRQFVGGTWIAEDADEIFEKVARAALLAMADWRP